MPVKFQASSEYEDHYAWHPSYKSASFAPSPDQAAVVAGCKSAQLGLTFEPPLQRRKHPIAIGVTQTVAPLDDDSSEIVSTVDDEYVLLGSHDKFADNVKYRNVPRKRSKSGDKKSSPKLSKTYKVRKPEAENGGKVDSKTKVIQQKKDASPPRIKSPQPKETPSSPPPAPRYHVPKKSPPKEKPSKDVTRMNNVTQTNLDKGIADSTEEAPADYAMKYRAGIAPKLQPGMKRLSEYKQAFNWKKQDPPLQSPLISADEIIHKSDSALGPFKSRVAQVSEYKNQFKKWKPQPAEPQLEPKPRKSADSPPKTKITKTKSTESLASAPAKVDSAPVDKKKAQEATNPQKPFFPHGKHRRTKSEYASNFRAPCAYSYNNGAWTGANPPHVRSARDDNEGVEPVKTNWYQEVLELRRKADEYRKRAQGTHFSGSHLGQLMARTAALWEASPEPSTSRTISALDLETCSQTSKTSKTKDKVVSKKTEKPRPSVTREAWTDDAKSESTVRTSRSTMGSDHDTHEVSESDNVMPDAVDEESDDEGRIPTPRLRVTEDDKRRHHLDRTTPAVGGALLTSPQPIRTWIHRQLNRSPSPSTDRVSPVQQQTRVSSERSPKKTSPLSQTKRPVRKTASAPLPQQPEVKCSCGVESEEVDQQSEHSAQIRGSPTYGKPTPDFQPLRDEEASTDRTLQTAFVPQPRKSPVRVSREPNFNVPQTINEGFGVTYNKPAVERSERFELDLNQMADEVDDDQLSVSIRSIASSCSLASETLDRARARRDDFWGKSTGPSA